MRRSGRILGLLLALVAGAALWVGAGARAAGGAGMDPDHRFECKVVAVERNADGHLSVLTVSVPAGKPDHAAWKEWLGTAVGSPVNITISKHAKEGPGATVTAKRDEDAAAVLGFDFPGQMANEPQVGGTAYVWY